MENRSMAAWQVSIFSLLTIGVIAGLYGLHRLALRLEERGHLYYLHKQPKGSGVNAFFAIQEAIEPQARYVMQVRDETYHHVSEPGGPDHPSKKTNPL